MKPPPVLTRLCLLVALVGGNLVQFGVMIERVTGKSALQYNDYGCYCGIGGSHWPVDPTDWCCHAHDCCYGRVEKLGCEPKLEKYFFSASKHGVFCGSSLWGHSRGEPSQKPGPRELDPPHCPGPGQKAKPPGGPKAGRTTCQRETCECDKRAALCFRHNLGSYDRKYANYPNRLCTGPTPPC